MSVWLIILSNSGQEMIEHSGIREVFDHYSVKKE